MFYFEKGKNNVKVNFSKSRFKKGDFQGSEWWIQKGTSFDREPINFLLSVFCWQNRITLTYRLLLCVMIIKQNRRDLLSMLTKGNKIQNLLQITVLCLNKSTILLPHCSDTIYIVQLSLNHSFPLKYDMEGQLEENSTFYPYFHAHGQLSIPQEPEERPLPQDPALTLLCPGHL